MDIGGLDQERNGHYRPKFLGEMREYLIDIPVVPDKNTDFCFRLT